VKSLRPDLVPQTIPHQSDAISFPKAPFSIRNGLFALSESIKERNEIPNQVTFNIETGKQRVQFFIHYAPFMKSVSNSDHLKIDEQKYEIRHHSTSSALQSEILF
jgi:hypothetical protein